MNMDPNLNILIIEPDQLIALELEKRLKNLGITRCRKVSYDEPINQLKLVMPDVTIIGRSMDAEICMKCIHKLKIIDPWTPILISIEDCLPIGPAYAPFEGVYYLEPDPGEEAISDSINVALTYKAGRDSRSEYPIIIGQSREIRAMKQKLRKVADKDITVLITGETGTGKELVARSIHFHSQRSRGPLVKVDCASLPDDLLESEVFGFQKGAFTDAHKDKPGRLELADGGTLFFDEIGNLSLSMQIKFLQIFEDKEFSRLGGLQDRTIDSRVVVATNSDLWKKMRESGFRKDLFYRLNPIQIHLPPLRERKDDIPLLTHYFINQYCYNFKREPLDIPKDVSNLFTQYPWPGNIRELENVIRRAIAVSDWDFALRELTSYNPPEGDQTDLEQEDELTGLFKKNDFSLKKIGKTYIAEAEKRAILTILKQTGWNRIKAARLLGVSYKTLINRIEEFDLKP
jgi:two-component system response regulator AtoC